MTTAPDDGVPVVSETPDRRWYINEDGEVYHYDAGYVKHALEFPGDDPVAHATEAEAQKRADRLYPDNNGWVHAMAREEAREEALTKRILSRVDSWTDEEFELALGFARDTRECMHCGHDIVEVEGAGWIDPNAPTDGLLPDGVTWEPGHPTDDAIWREACPDNDTERAAPHEPV